MYGFTPSQCQWMADSIMAEIQHKYNLRPRIGNPKIAESTPLRKAFAAKRVPETTTTHQVGVPLVPPRPQNTLQALRMQTETREMEKMLLPFDFEHEL